MGLLSPVKNTRKFITKNFSTSPFHVLISGLIERVTLGKRDLINLGMFLHSQSSCLVMLPLLCSIDTMSDAGQPISTWMRIFSRLPGKEGPEQIPDLVAQPVPTHQFLLSGLLKSGPAG